MVIAVTDCGCSETTGAGVSGGEKGDADDAGGEATGLDDGGSFVPSAAAVESRLALLF